MRVSYRFEVDWHSSHCGDCSSGLRLAKPAKELETLHQSRTVTYQCVISASPNSPQVIVSPSIIDHLDWTAIFSILTMVVVVWMSNSPELANQIQNINWIQSMLRG